MGPGPVLTPITPYYHSVMPQLVCPLCYHPHPTVFHQDNKRTYFICPVCELVFVHPDHYVSPAAEKKRYDLHQNSSDDPGYERFLEQLAQPVRQRIQAGASGLDFGSGPFPELQALLQAAGYVMNIYDPFYAPDRAAFEANYAFITAAEVVEHLQAPRRELDRLWDCLLPGGLLAIMTDIRHPAIEFKTWHYISDPTHVVYYAPATFIWLGQHWGVQVEFSGETVALFQKDS